MKEKYFFDSTITFFNENPLVNFISFSLGILGIIFSVFFYIKSIKNKKPIYILRTISLIKEKLQKIDTVEILYSGDKINNLSISKIAIWNDGKETINFSDIAQNDTLRIDISSEYEILDCEILFHKNNANDFNLVLNSNRKSIDIKFDFFDFEEGIVIQVFHTGKSSDDIFINGTIKSVKKITRREYVLSLFPTGLFRRLNSEKKNSENKKTIGKRKIKLLFGTIVLITGIMLCSAPFFDPFKEISTNKPNEYSKLAILLPGIIYCWMGIKMLKRNIPKGFNIFEEEF